MNYLKKTINMKKFKFIILLLLTPTLARPQERVMLVHHDNVVYAVNISQLDSITFKPSLANTKWELIGFVETKTGVVTKVSLKSNVEEGYILVFHSNGKLSGTTSFYSFLESGKYIVDYNTSIIEIRGIVTAKSAGADNERGYSTTDLEKVESFSIVNDYLRLYYNNKENYLLYKKL